MVHITDENRELARALGVEDQLDKAEKEINNLQFVKQTPPSFAPDVKKWDVDSEYGIGSYWKNPGEDYFRVMIPGQTGNIKTNTASEAKVAIKEAMLKKATREVVKKAAYTGNYWGIGQPELTTKGERAKNLLKKAGWSV